MIKSVTVTNYLGDSVKLELMRPEKSGFIVKSINGLGPSNASINTTEVSTNDGALFNSARLSKRNIVFKLLFMNTDTETIEDIRQKTYKYFPMKKGVTLLIETDNRLVSTTGYVETNEPNIFDSKEGSTIYLVCRLLLEKKTITIHAIGEATNITIYNTGTREKLAIETDKLAALTGSGIIAGDTITITTMKGRKGITLLRNGKVINILNCLKKGSNWFTLAKGDNIFAYTAETGSSNLQFRMENKIIYDGV